MVVVESIAGCVMSLLGNFPRMLVQLLQSISVSLRYYQSYINKTLTESLLPGTLPLSLRIKCILCTPRPIRQSTYWPIVDRCIVRYINRHSVGRHIYRHSADILTKICLSTYRPIYRSIVAQYSTDMSVDMSTESGCLIVGRHVDREATDISPILHWYLVTGDCTLRRRRNVT